MIVARAPGRVNLIGDHTDYVGGLVLPMAINRVTEVRGEPGGSAVAVRSEQFDGTAKISLDIDEPAVVEPSWARYVAGVVVAMRPRRGFVGTISSDIPIGAGLSSSASLEVALALALGFEGTVVELAQLCQRAEHLATGTPTGIMDQLVSAAGVAGHALLIDCHTLDIRPVALPTSEAEIVVVHSGLSRELGAGAYGRRVAECARAEAEIGPLRLATPSMLSGMSDPVARRRARHVITEIQRVRAFIAALVSGDLNQAGQVMIESHASLRDDYEVTTPQLDALVRRLTAKPGVFGARMTGGGFGGCVVALCRPGALGDEGWALQATDGARVTDH